MVSRIQLPWQTDSREYNKEQITKKKSALLFSAGVDSLYSAMRCKRKPILYTIWGADIPLSERSFWEKTKNHLNGFSKNFGFELKTVKTSMSELVNGKLVVRQLKLRDWWGEVSHSILMLSLLSPSIFENGSEIIISSTHAPGHSRRWGSMPDLDSSIRYCGVTVEHIRDVNRQEKLQYLVANHPEALKYLRVCYSNFDSLNCSRCEKCARTMIGLIIAGFDPDLCGFKFDKKIYETVMQNYKGGSWYFFAGYWENLKENITKKVSKSPHYNPAFFEWLKSADFKNYKFNPKKKRREEIKTYLRDAFPLRLPKRLLSETKHRLWRLRIMH